MSAGAWTGIVIAITVVIVSLITTMLIVRKKKGKGSCCSDCSSCPYCTGTHDSVCSCRKDSTEP